MAEPQLNGCVQFLIVANPQEMRHWPARRIAQFFNGVAQIVRMAGKNAQFEIMDTTPLTARKEKEGERLP
jgi:hypothetical protein